MRKNGASTLPVIDPGPIFGREQELASLRQRLHKGQSLLVHGPAGVGKTLLLRAILPDFPAFLYCGESATIAVAIRQIALELLRAGSPLMHAACPCRESLDKKSSSSLKGLVLDVLHHGKYRVVLDHLRRPSPAFAATARELLGWAATPIVAVARSRHMEDVGALHAFFPDRGDRFELRNFDPAAAERFAHFAAEQIAVCAENLDEFLHRVAELSAGNPSAILTMLTMAKQPRYRSQQRIKLAPLYVDFRLGVTFPVRG